MEKELLIEFRNNLIKIIDECNYMSEADKTELMINLFNFLNPDTYDKNVKKLRNVKSKEKN